MGLIVIVSLILFAGFQLYQFLKELELNIAKILINNILILILLDLLLKSIFIKISMINIESYEIMLLNSKKIGRYFVLINIGSPNNFFALLIVLPFIILQYDNISGSDCFLFIITLIFSSIINKLFVLNMLMFIRNRLILILIITTIFSLILKFYPSIYFSNLVYISIISFLFCVIFSYKTYKWYPRFKYFL